MYTAFPISLRAGQVGVLTFTAGAGSTLGTIEGALFESDPDAPDAALPPPTPCVVQGNVLYIPPLPVGMHLFEVRVDGGTVVYQHIEVQPSPLGADPGSAAWEVVASRVGGEWHYAISAPVGPAGAPGKSAYDIWLAAGNVGSEADFLASLQGPAGRDGRDGKDGQPGKSPSAAEVAAELIPMIAMEVALEGPTASYNGQCNYFQLGAAYLTERLVLKQLGYRVRFDSVEGCAAGPVYLGVWERSEDGAEWVKLGVSLDTQEHEGTLDMLWSFEVGAVRLSGRPIRCCLLASREDDWREDLLMGLRTAGTSDADTRLWYNGTEWTSVPKFFICGYKTGAPLLVGDGAESGGGVDEAAVREIAAEEVEKALYDSLPGEIVLAADANDNINCVSLELDAMHTPTARVSTIRLLARDAGAVSGQAVYLSAWEQVSGEDYKLLAVSDNTQVQVAGQWSVWEFANLRLSGKRMRYAALATPDTPFAQASTLYMRCAPRPEGDSSLIHTSSSPIAYLPAMAIVTATGDAIFAPASHPKDAEAHLTKEEHARLTEMLESGGNGTGSSGGENDTTTQLSKEELTQLKQLLKEYKEGTLGGENSNCDHAGDGVGSINLGGQARAEGSASIAFGLSAMAYASDSISIGSNSSSGGIGRGDIAIGYCAYTDMSFSLSIGNCSRSRGRASAALGYCARAYEDGVFVLATSVENRNSGFEAERITQLYLISQGSPLAKKYTDGEAALGYIVVDEGGTDNDWTKISASGTRKLSELLTDNKGSFVPDVFSFNEKTIVYANNA